MRDGEKIKKTTKLARLPGMISLMFDTTGVPAGCFLNTLKSGQMSIISVPYSVAAIIKRRARGQSLMP